MLMFMSKGNAKFRHSGGIETQAHLFVNDFVAEMLTEGHVELDLEPGDCTRYALSVHHVVHHGQTYYVWLMRNPSIACETFSLPNEEFSPEYIINLYNTNIVTAHLVAELHHLLIEEPEYCDADEYEPTWYNLSTAITVGQPGF